MLGTCWLGTWQKTFTVSSAETSLFLIIMFSLIHVFKTSCASACFMRWLPGLQKYLDPDVISIHLTSKPSYLDFLRSLSFPLSSLLSYLVDEEMIQVLLGSCYSNFFCQQMSEDASVDAHYFPYILHFNLICQVKAFVNFDFCLGFHRLFLSLQSFSFHFYHPLFLYELCFCQ